MMPGRIYWTNGLAFRCCAIEQRLGCPARVNMQDVGYDQTPFPGEDREWYLTKEASVNV